MEVLGIRILGIIIDFIHSLPRGVCDKAWYFVYRHVFKGMKRDCTFVLSMKLPIICVLLSFKHYIPLNCGQLFNILLELLMCCNLVFD